MEEIYWLQRIGALSDFFSITWAIATIVFVLAVVISCIATVDDEDDVLKRAKKYTKFSFLVIVISVLGDIFTPSTKEMYAIYGLGGTIDYIKSNDNAKQLPDKCIDALTRYVDSIEKENEDNNE